MKADWEIYFPFSKIRPAQREAIDFVIDSFKNKTYANVQAATGTGKSAIALALAKYYSNIDGVSGAYIITTQKVLQKQYVNDFENIANIWGKDNYKCSNSEYRNVSCKTGSLLNILFKKACESCPYTLAKDRFLKSSISLTNVPYFLNLKDIPKRKLLIIDECHNIEQSIIDFVCINVRKELCEELNILFPEIDTIEQFNVWVKEHYSVELLKLLEQYKNDIVSMNEHQADFRLYLKKIEDLEVILSQLDRYLNHSQEKWVLSLGENFIEAKPLHAGPFIKSLLFSCAEKVLMMSATILDHDTFIRNIGISKNDSAFLNLPSPFKKENRKVYYAPVGSMSYSSIEKTLPVLHDTISSIIDEYRGKKGIIHTHTYTIAKYLKDNDKTGRLLLHDSRDRMDILEEHLKSKKDTILLSPSFTEGIDLRNDFSRFQIICKIPYPYLGDNYIKTKMQVCKNWYEWQTAKTLIQSLGRSIRSEKDYADSYILDSAWAFFYKKNRFLFPEWFREAVINL